jgi:chemotaxis protein methyltransferase CheR
MVAQRNRLVESLVGWTGIDLERAGRNAAVDHFLDNRTRALGMSAKEYVDSLDGPDHPEVKELVEAVTVGHTWFYRDPAQLEIISKLALGAFGTEEQVRVWVPACATGEDVYTLAMLADRDGWNGSILGTDINASFIARARKGYYGEWSFRNLPKELRSVLQPVGGPDDGVFEVVDRIRSAVSFRRHNLMDHPILPAERTWNIILCRNVLIYFRPAKIATTIEVLARTLAPNGWLFLGASDVISNKMEGVRQISLEGRAAFQRESARWRVSRRTQPPPKEPADTRPTVATLPATPVVTQAPLPSPTPSPSPTKTSPHDALLARGVAALEAGDIPRALVDLIATLELDPLCGEAHLFTGIAYHLGGDPPSAIQALRAASLLEPDLWLASFYLALNYEKLGQAAAASREFRHVGIALGQPEAARRRTLLSDKLAMWEDEIATLARSRSL